jgi:hypothetical protein
MYCLENFILIGPDSNTFKSYLNLSEIRKENFYKVVYLQSFPTTKKFKPLEMIAGKKATSNLATYIKYRRLRSLMRDLNVNSSLTDTAFSFRKPSFGLNKKKMKNIYVNDINDEVVLDVLAELDRSKKILFAGGGIVGPKILELGFEIIHCHLGYLPNYRGSDSIYWQLIEECILGYSVIRMNKAIDGGDILLRKKIKDLRFIKKYKLEIDEFFINYVLDPFLRAEGISAFLEKKDIGEIFQLDDYNAFYRMHPKMKQIALRKLKNEL